MFSSAVSNTHDQSAISPPFQNPSYTLQFLKSFLTDNLLGTKIVADDDDDEYDNADEDSDDNIMFVWL